MNIYQGDPKIFIDENGAYLKFTGGQPVMDAGLENAAILQLLIDKSWHGNLLLDEPIGSDFEEIAKKPITMTSLNKTSIAAENALSNDFFGKKTVTVENPESYRVSIAILIEPPGKDSGEIVLSKNGENWLFQRNNPAYRRR